MARHLAVQPSQCGGEAAAGRRQSVESQPGEHSGRSEVPGIGQQERCIPMVERKKVLSLLRLKICLLHVSSPLSSVSWDSKALARPIEDLKREARHHNGSAARRALQP